MLQQFNFTLRLWGCDVFLKLTMTIKYIFYFYTWQQYHTRVWNTKRYLGVNSFCSIVSITLKVDHRRYLLTAHNAGLMSSVVGGPSCDFCAGFSAPRSLNRRKAVHTYTAGQTDCRSVQNHVCYIDAGTKSETRPWSSAGCQERARDTIG